jgi:hypothetical protein
MFVLNHPIDVQYNTSCFDGWPYLVCEVRLVPFSFPFLVDSVIRFGIVRKKESVACLAAAVFGSQPLVGRVA